MKRPFMNDEQFILETMNGLNKDIIVNYRLSEKSLKRCLELDESSLNTIFGFQKISANFIIENHISEPKQKIFCKVKLKDEDIKKIIDINELDHMDLYLLIRFNTLSLDFYKSVFEKLDIFSILKLLKSYKVDEEFVRKTQISLRTNIMNNPTLTLQERKKLIKIK